MTNRNNVGIIKEGRTETGRTWLIERDARIGLYEVWYAGCEFGGAFDTYEEALAEVNGEYDE